MASVRNGSSQEFEEIVKRNEKKILRVAESITHNSEDAKEIVQETFTKAYTHLCHFRGGSSLRTWLVRIAINEALMRRRKRSFVMIPMEEVLGPGREFTLMGAARRDYDPEELCAQAELERILLDNVRKLNRKCRAAFVLRDICDFQTRKAAQLAGLSVSGLKSCLHRSRQKLRECLAPYFKQTSSITYANQSRMNIKRSAVKKTESDVTWPETMRSNCGQMPNRVFRSLSIRQLGGRRNGKPHKKGHIR